MSLVESTSARRHSYAFHFFHVENLRKKPPWKLGEGREPRTSLGSEISGEKLPLGLGCEAGGRARCCLGSPVGDLHVGWSGGLMTPSGAPTSLAAIF